MCACVFVSLEDFLPPPFLSTLGQMIQLIWDLDAYGFTLTPSKCSHRDCPKTLWGKIIFKLNDIYSTQKLCLISLLKVLYCIGRVAWQNKHSRDEWHCKRPAITMAYLQSRSSYGGRANKDVYPLTL